MSKVSNKQDKDVCELITLVREGDGTAFERLLAKYEPMINSTVIRYTPAGEDIDDSRQEALAGFYRATLKFDMGQPDVAFGLFAKICVTNALISHARELKRRIGGSNENINYEEYLRFATDVMSDPAEQIIERENEAELRELIRNNLSEYENRVWDMYIAGASVREIAEAIGASERSIDNALYRIRRKLRRLIEAGGR